ncbi:lysophospholipid acyltransferase family protein [Butyrivibrio sp. MC2013]|uniref:lysophospholipid acyltransferase family protein n=1 Tax=Butyrivibrio sp. MC2013 TaxID=1280686 RepID=UPI00042A2EF5|nr:lysophospholipid acyltransferase family protein [Butyrivibrio sp. MC2013]
MLRLIIAVLFLAVFLVLSIPVIGIMFIIRHFNKNAASRAALFNVSLAFKVLSFIAGIKLTVKGRENIPTDEAVLYIGNHKSDFDTVISYPLVKGPTGYIAKKEVKKVPILGWWMILMNCLFMDRSDIKQSAQVIFDAIDMIKGGTSICIFPEGTRSDKEDDLLPFHKGSFKPAQRTDCPIVPMVISGSRDVFENHFPWIKSARVTIEYLPPVRFSELSADDQKKIHEYFRNMIRDKYLENTKALKG